MKTNPYLWFADLDLPRTVVNHADRLVSRATDAGDADGASATLGSVLFGNAASFDFSRLVHAIVPAVAPAPVAPAAPAVVVSDDALSDLDADAPSVFASALAMPLIVDEAPLSLSLSPGRIPDLGFLQNLPATALVWQPGFEPSAPVIGASDGAVVPAIDAPVAVAAGAPLTRADLIHELTPAVVADATVPLALLFGDQAGEAALVRDPFVLHPAPLPDPIVDPGLLV